MAQLDPQVLDQVPHLKPRNIGRRPVQFVPDVSSTWILDTLTPSPQKRPKTETTHINARTFVLAHLPHPQKINKTSLAPGT